MFVVVCCCLCSSHGEGEWQEGDMLVSATGGTGVSELERRIQVQVLKASNQSIWVLDLPASGPHLRYVVEPDGL